MSISLEINYSINIITSIKDFINTWGTNIENNDISNNIYDLIILISKIIKSNNFLKDKTLDNIIKQNTDHSIEKTLDKIQLIKLYSDICIIKYLIKIAINKIKLINNDLHNFDKNTQTVLMEKYNIILLRHKKRKEINKLDIYKELYNKLDIIKYVDQNPFIDNNELNKLDEYVINNFTLFKVYKNIIIKVINKLLSYNKSETQSNYIYLLLSHIEKIKNLILCKDIIYNNSITRKDFILEITNNNNTNNNANNPFIKTFGLSPISKFNTLKDTTIIMQKFFKKRNNANYNLFDDIKKESDLCNIIKKFNTYDTKNTINANDSKDNICIIILNKLIIKPIEFDISKLYDKKEINNYTLNEKSGVNDIYISKFNTIKFKEINKKWDFNIIHYGNLDADNFIILEKINMETYRFLKKYNNINTKYDAYTMFTGVIDSYGIYNNKNIILGLLSFISNKNTIYDSDRINSYNNILEKNIVKNMFLCNKVNNVELNKSSKLIDITMLKYNLNEALLQTINNLNKNKKMFKNKKDILLLIHNDHISDCFSNFLVISILEYINEQFKDCNSNYYVNELLKTFISQLLLLKVSFQKKIHDMYVSTESELTSLNIKDINSFLEKLFISVLDIIITVDDNIFLSIIYKKKLLEVAYFK